MRARRTYKHGRCLRHQGTVLLSKLATGRRRIAQGREEARACDGRVQLRRRLLAERTAAVVRGRAMDSECGQLESLLCMDLGNEPEKEKENEWHRHCQEASASANVTVWHRHRPVALTGHAFDLSRHSLPPRNNSDNKNQHVLQGPVLLVRPRHICRLRRARRAGAAQRGPKRSVPVQVWCEHRQHQGEQHAVVDALVLLGRSMKGQTMASKPIQ